MEKMDSFHIIKYALNRDVKYFLPESYPELPFIASYVLLPHNADIEKIVITGGKKENFKGTCPVRLSIPSPSNESDYIRYNNPELYAGYRIIKIFICPFRYSTESNHIVFFQKVNFDIFYQTNTKPLNLERSDAKIKLSRQFIRGKVINQVDIEKIVPLEEKMDYSGLDFFRNETDSLQKSKKEIQKLNKAEEPFYIRQIK